MPVTRSQSAPLSAVEVISEEGESDESNSSESGILAPASPKMSGVPSTSGQAPLIPPPMAQPIYGAALQPQATQRSRFHYRPFKGRPKDDPDEWLAEFEATAKANGEGAIKLTILPAVMKGEARPWLNLQPPGITWPEFQIAFLQEF